MDVFTAIEEPEAVISNIEVRLPLENVEIYGFSTERLGNLGLLIRKIAFERMLLYSKLIFASILTKK
jgi:hypothetical protein